jgi:hypothetical protein
VHRLIAILLSLLIGGSTFCQKEMGMEQYYYWQKQTTSTIVPKLYYQTKKNWYAEMRYNYEELQSASIHFGKKIKIASLPELNITPVAGVVFGNLNGWSAGTVLELSMNKFSFSSEPQYVCSFKKDEECYFYSWSEIVYDFSSFAYAGAALQHTKWHNSEMLLEPGVVAGFTVKNFTLPIYIFSPFTAGRNFVLGINWHWQKSK